MEKYQAQVDTFKMNSGKLNESNSCFGDAFDHEAIVTGKVCDKNEDLRAVLDKERADNKRLKSEVGDMQAKYMEVAETRLEFQKTMAKILNLIQDSAAPSNDSKDADIIAETLAIALDCESEGKAEMAALEAETAPEMDYSEVSSSSLSDSFKASHLPY